MKQNDFWILALIVLTMLGFLIGWNIPIKIAVIANSLLILWQVAARIWEAQKHGR